MNKRQTMFHGDVVKGVLRFVLCWMLLVVGCAHLPYRSVSEVKSRTVGLERGMPDDEVRKALGEPDEKEGTLCGANTEQGEWECIIWTYHTDNPQLSLRVYFQKGKSGLSVNNWNW